MAATLRNRNTGPQQHPKKNSHRFPSVNVAEERAPALQTMIRMGQSVVRDKPWQLKKVGSVHFHDLRHTAASWMRMQGADVHTVAQVLGHKDLRMATRYQHLSSGFLASAGGHLDAIFGQPKQLEATST